MKRGTFAKSEMRLIENVWDLREWISKNGASWHTKFEKGSMISQSSATPDWSWCLYKKINHLVKHSRGKRFIIFPYKEKWINQDLCDNMFAKNRISNSIQKQVKLLSEPKIKEVIQLEFW